MVGRMHNNDNAMPRRSPPSACEVQVAGLAICVPASPAKGVALPGRPKKTLDAAVELRPLGSGLQSPFDFHVQSFPFLRAVGVDLRHGDLRLILRVPSGPDEDRDHIDAVPVAVIAPREAVRGNFGRSGHLLIFLPTEPTEGRWIHANLDVLTRRRRSVLRPLQFQAIQLHAAFPEQRRPERPARRRQHAALVSNPSLAK